MSGAERQPTRLAWLWLAMALAGGVAAQEETSTGQQETTTPPTSGARGPLLLVEVRGPRAVINTGIDKLRLRTPIRVGARIRMSAELQSARALPGGGVRVGVGVRFEVEGEARPACTATVNLAYLP